MTSTFPIQRCLPIFAPPKPAISVTSMSSSGGSHAKISAQPGAERVSSMATALVFGTSLSGSYAIYDPEQCYWRMSPALSPRVKAKMGRLCPQTWTYQLLRYPKWGMTADGVLSRLPMPVPRIDVTGGGALQRYPTPSTSAPVQAVKYYANKTDWHTPIGNDAVKCGNMALIPANGLAAQSRFYGTPRASDANGVGKRGSKSQQHNEQRGYLIGQVADYTNRQLNPDWEETLMGYPVGWTSIAADNSPRKGSRRISSPRHQVSSTHGRSRYYATRKHRIARRVSKR